MENKDFENIQQPVIVMNYCSDDCTGCGDNCTHNVDVTKSLWGWIRNIFHIGRKEKS